MLLRRGHALWEFQGQKQVAVTILDSIGRHWPPLSRLHGQRPGPAPADLEGTDSSHTKNSTSRHRTHTCWCGRIQTDPATRNSTSSPQDLPTLSWVVWIASAYRNSTQGARMSPAILKRVRIVLATRKSTSGFQNPFFCPRMMQITPLGTSHLAFGRLIPLSQEGLGNTPRGGAETMAEPQEAVRLRKLSWKSLFTAAQLQNDTSASGFLNPAPVKHPKDRSDFSSCGLCGHLYMQGLGQIRVQTASIDPALGPDAWLLQYWDLLSVDLHQ